MMVDVRIILSALWGSSFAERSCGMHGRGRWLGSRGPRHFSGRALTGGAQEAHRADLRAVD